MIFSGYVVYQKIKPREIKHDYYTIEPEPWVEDTPFTDEENDVKISVSRATRSKSKFDIDKQEIYDKGLKTLFSNGLYKGMPLGIAKAILNESTELIIGPEMDPDDGVVEAFILGKYEEDEFAFYIFLDEDWKKQIPDTNILYANDLDESTVRKYDFTSYTKGIYIDKVKGDFDWFLSSPRKGGVFVGEINKETLDIEDLRLTNLTIIYVR